MKLRFWVIAGPNQGSSFELREGVPQMIGRSHQHNDICLNDLSLSRVHCEVQTDGDVITITDLDSDGGVFVNGNRVGKQALRQGDVVTIGGTQMKLSVDEPTAPVASAAPPAAAPPAAAPDRLKDLAGTQFGHFEIGQVVGKGHSGVVFRARDIKANRDVALKVLRSEFPKGDEEMQRFARVVKTVLPVRHPNLVSLFGAGKTGPYCWLATEYVAGESLGQRIQRMGKPVANGWSEALRATLHVGRALECAHQHKLIHGNITATNVLAYSAENFMLGDVVLARALEGSALRQVLFRNKILSELYYLAPEQTHPQAKIDARTDLYSLGAVIHALLAGGPPFMSKSQGETIAKIRHEEPVRPGRLQPGIPPKFERAVMKLLAKQPEERYPSANDLLQDLKGIEA
jgi:serine/threonine protein kinase